MKIIFYLNPLNCHFEYNALINIIINSDKNPIKPITRFEETSPLLQSVNILLIKPFLLDIAFSLLAELVRKGNFIINMF